VIQERTLARFILRKESARAILGRDKEGRKRYGTKDCSRVKIECRNGFFREAP